MSFGNWPESVTKDFVTLFCGEKLGEGCSREVYVCRLDPTKVVKVETTAHSFQNVIEWETWEALRWTAHGKWLAPCHHISVCGICLVQERTDPLTEKYRQRKLPEWLSDHKPENYGVIKDQVVARDYGTNLLLNHGAFGSKKRKPKWLE